MFIMLFHLQSVVGIRSNSPKTIRNSRLIRRSLGASPCFWRFHSWTGSVLVTLPLPGSHWHWLSPAAFTLAIKVHPLSSSLFQPHLVRLSVVLTRWSHAVLSCCLVVLRWSFMKHWNFPSSSFIHGLKLYLLHSATKWTVNIEQAGIRMTPWLCDVWSFEFNKLMRDVRDANV